MSTEIENRHPDYEVDSTSNRTMTVEPGKVDSHQADGYVCVPVCIFHDNKWRSNYQFAVNHLRAVGILPTPCVQLFGKEVCSCKGRDIIKEGVGMTTEDLGQLKTWTFEKLKCWTNLESFLHLLERLFSACETSQLQPSVQLSPNFILCLRELLRQTFTRFLSSGAKVVKPLSNGQFQLDNVRSHCLGLVIGKQGTHIKPLCRKYDTKAKIRVKNRCYGNEAIEVTVKSKSVNDLLAFKAKLIAMANVVQAKSDRRMRIRSEAVWRRMDKMHISNTKGTYYADQKTVATEHYERKHKKHSGTLEERNDKRTPILEYGRCRYCLSPFKKHDDMEGSCRYHEGYIVARKTSLRWSCCRRKAVERHPTMESHLNGCRRGRHCWRISKRCSPKAGKWRCKGVGKRASHAVSLQM